MSELHGWMSGKEGEGNGEIKLCIGEEGDWGLDFGGRRRTEKKKRKKHSPKIVLDSPYSSRESVRMSEPKL